MLFRGHHSDRCRSTKSVRLVEDAIAKERPVIGILTQKDARTEDPGSGDLYMVGCAARILKVIKPRRTTSRSSCKASRASKSRRSTAQSRSSRRETQRSRSDVERCRARCARDEPQGHREARRQADARAAEGAGALVDSVTEAGHLADLITSHLELGSARSKTCSRRSISRRVPAKFSSSCRASSKCSRFRSASTRRCKRRWGATSASTCCANSSRRSRRAR